MNEFEFGSGVLYEVNEQFFEPKSLVVDITRQCTEACKHCVVAASPRRRERLSLPQITTAVEDARRNGFVSVSFYGGEPFVAKDDLYAAVKMVYENGLQPQIMSNGFWGRTMESAHKVFDELAAVQPPDGITLSINLSTDEFHTKVPYQSLANIIAAWAGRPERIDVNLAIGDSGKEEYVQTALTAILDAADSALQGTGMCTCDRQKHIRLGGGYSIGIIDKFLRINETTTAPELIALLTHEEMLPSHALETLSDKTFEDVRDLQRIISANDWLALAQNADERSRGEYRAGRYRDQKEMQFRAYSINLFGEGKALQHNEELVRRIAFARQKSYREVNIHEYESTLMLGSDNCFYAYPIHLQHAVRPLGENTGNAISRVVNLVNEGETISHILRLQDVTTAKMFLLSAGDRDAYKRCCALESKGLYQEAIEELLLSKPAMEQMPQTWSLYCR